MSSLHPPVVTPGVESVGGALGIRVSDVHSLGGREASSAGSTALGISVDEALLLCSGLANELRSLYHGLAGKKF